MFSWIAICGDAKKVSEAVFKGDAKNKADESVDSWCNSWKVRAALNIMVCMVSIPFSIYSIFVVRKHHLFLLGGGNFFQMSLGTKAPSGGAGQPQNFKAGPPPAAPPPDADGAQPDNVGASQAQTPVDGSQKNVASAATA